MLPIDYARHTPCMSLNDYACHSLEMHALTDYARHSLTMHVIHLTCHTLVLSSLVNGNVSWSPVVSVHEQG